MTLREIAENLHRNYPHDSKNRFCISDAEVAFLINALVEAETKLVELPYGYRWEGISKVAREVYICKATMRLGIADVWPVKEGS